jgi:hypothetical protein
MDISSKLEVVEMGQLLAGIADVNSRLGEDANLIYLTGGTAVAAYTGVNRPLSLDLDFFVPKSLREKVVSAFGGEYVYFGEKPLFKSMKLVGVTNNGVELDFIETQTIVPDANKPNESIALMVDDYVSLNAQERENEGVKFKLVPPEYILLAKLFAGRGINIGKYDLVDCRSLLLAGVVDLEKLEKLIIRLSTSDEVKQVILDRLRLSFDRILLDNPDNESILKSIHEIRTRIGV